MAVTLEQQNQKRRAQMRHVRHVVVAGVTVPLIECVDSLSFDVAVLVCGGEPLEIAIPAVASILPIFDVLNFCGL